MTDQMTAIKGILTDALSELTPEQLVALTMTPFRELREDRSRRRLSDKVINRGGVL